MVSTNDDEGVIGYHVTQAARKHASDRGGGLPSMLILAVSLIHARDYKRIAFGEIAGGIVITSLDSAR